VEEPQLAGRGVGPAILAASVAVPDEDSGVVGLAGAVDGQAAVDGRDAQRCGGGGWRGLTGDRQVVPLGLVVPAGRETDLSERERRVGGGAERAAVEPGGDGTSVERQGDRVPGIGAERRGGATGQCGDLV